MVAFVGMTGYGAGLDRSRQVEGALLPVRWISIPMAIAIVIGALAGLAGVLTLA